MPLSAYELERADNIRRNQEKLRSLGLETPFATTVVTRVKGAAQTKKPKAEKPAPRVRSLRAQNLDPEGKPLPDKEVLPSPTPEPEPKRQRLASVPLDATTVSTTGTTPAHEASTFLARLGMLAGSSSDTTPTADGGGFYEGYCQDHG